MNAFDSPGLLEWLEAASAAALDTLPFGLVAMAADTVVVHYNLAESRLSGLTPMRVVGRRFFADVAPCSNNASVAGRFDTASSLDALVDTVFTFKLEPVRVRLRLLKRAGARRMYLAVRGLG